ncbi:MAG: TetR/AcrR family transcriptional regulator [Actinomycetia bacterium]|nr:TetR/AcrR family transcriptional regulator [Actinomycetes bacterium]
MPRATRMQPDDRRAAIIAATRDVLTREGVGFTTRDVAEAAGVAEGTIFRVFPSKDDLLAAVVADLFDLTPTCERLEALTGGNSLEAQIEAIVRIIRDQVGGVHSAEVAMAAMSKAPAEAAEFLQASVAARHASIARLRAAAAQLCPDDVPDPRETFTRLRAAVTTALAPYQDQLRLRTDQVAAWIWFGALATTHPFLSRIATINPDEVVNLLVHGIAKERTDPSC